MTVQDAALAVATLVDMCDRMSATAVVGGESVDLSPVVSGVRSGLLLALAVITEDEAPGEKGLESGLTRAVRLAFEAELCGEEG